MDTTEIPVPGTPAYWAAQREAVALLKAYNFGHPDLLAELGALRQIAAHGFAASMMAAQGNCLPELISGLEQMAEALEADDEEEDPDAPPHGAGWCRRGCQILHGMECGICGYDGPGVWAGKVATVAEHCCHCDARTYQSPEGICELCGMDAETPDEPAPQAAVCFGDCGPVSGDAQCGQCRELERHARSAVDEAGQAGSIAPGLATAAALARAALARSHGPLDSSRCGQPQP